MKSEKSETLCKQAEKALQAQKQAEADLRESEEKFRLIATHSPDVVFFQDYDLRYAWMVNPAPPFTEDQVIGKTDFDLLSREEAERLAKIKRTILDTGTGARVEIPLTIGGKKYYYYAVYEPTRDNEGRILGIFGYAHNITERKQAEEELRRAKELSDALNSINTAINSTLDLNEIMLQVIEKSAKAIGAETAVIDIIEGDHWVAKYLYGFPEEYIGTEFTDEDIPHGVIAARTKQPVVVNNAYNDKIAHFEVMKKFGIRSFLVIPLLTKDSTIGLIFFNKSTPAAFTDAQFDFANKLGASVSLAIQNSQFFEERKQAEEALRKAYDELEIRIQERTKELRETNKTLQAEIEERRRAEEAVKAERQRFNDILDMLPAYLVLLSPDYHVSFANRFFRERFGESRGFRCFEYLFKRCEPCEICETYSVLKTMAPHHWEWTGPDGRNYDIFDFPFTDADGSTLIMEVGIDITERKQAEEKIREQATLLDNAQEAVGVRSLEHNLIYWNKGAERLYGWTAEEAIGKNPVEFLFKDKEEPPQLIEAKRSVLEKGEWTGELHQITKDGRDVIVESHWTLIYDNEGKPKSILVVNTDITEKKMFEAHLLRAQRMESIGILAGGIAHNLNNLLTPTMMSLRMLREKLKDEQSQKLLTILEKNSERSADLIKQVLSFSRGIEGERVPLHVANIVYEIEKIAKETFPRNIEIRTNMPIDIWTISGDETQLHQVLMNLCVNARDAMPDGGILSISAENFFIDENYARMHTDAKVGSYVAISVSDTGVGIPSKIVDRIFEPFFTTKEFGKGTGLGLSTAHAIVKSHGGFIDVHSQIGKGTTFRVYLPATITEMQNIEEQQLELPTGHGELVLVAEDEDSVREVTISSLEANGYKVLAANDGVQAVALYAQNADKIKVILMDMMMPVMDGEASIRAIRKINPQVNVIVVSGLAEKDKLAKIESTRAQAILPKPYTADRLLKTMYEVLSAK